MVPSLTIDDVLNVKYPSPPEWSTDGRYFAALVYEDDGQHVRIASAGNPTGSWRVDLGEESVAMIAWAPESKAEQLAVVSADGKLSLLDATQEAVEDVCGHVDADDLAWTSDGNRLAFYGDGKPTVLDLEEGTEDRYDLHDRGTFLGEIEMLAWGPDDRLLAYRFVEFGTKQIGVVDTDNGELVWRSREQAYSTSTPQWLGDGRLLVDRAGEHGTVREIVAVEVTDGTEQVLYREEDREHGTLSRGAPVPSPNGDKLAVALPEDGWEHIHVIDVESGRRTQLTEGDFEDKGVADSRPRWCAEDLIVFASNREDLGKRGIYTVDSDGESRTLVEPDGTNVHPRPSPDGETLAYIHAGRDTAPELRVLDISNGETDRVTRSTVTNWPIDPVEPDRVSFESVGGLDVEAYLIDPRKTDAVASDAEDLPAVVWVHGGPMRQMRDGWHPSRSYALPYTFHQYLAERGVVGLFVNYRGGIGYGTEFREALAGHRGDHEMQDIAEGAEYLRGLDFVDGSAIGMWGISYGGYAALQLLGTHPDTFDVAINLAGLADLELYRDWAVETKFPACASSMAVRLGGEPWEASEAWTQGSPVTHFENYENALYSFHGTGDRYVNFEQLDVAVDELLNSGADHEWEYYPDENHLFSERATWERVLAKVEAVFEDHLR